MKIVFFSHDDELEEFLQDAVTSADVVMTDAEDDAMSEVEEALDEEIPVVLFLDFDGTRKSAEKLNKHYFKNEEVTRVVFTAEMSVKELKKHQDSKLGAHAYMRKPLDAEAISELLMDIEACDTAVFEYESSDDLFESLPAGSPEVSADDEDESDNDVNFSAAELKMDTEVRYQLDRHNFNPENAFNFSDETNLKVQAAFDLAFGANEGEHADFPLMDKVDEEVEGIEAREEINQSNEDQSIVFDFGSEEESASGVPMGHEFDEDEETAETKLGENPRDILEQMESEREASLVGYRPPSLEETGDIEIPDEFRADSSSDSEDGPQFDIPESDDSEEGGLDLGNDGDALEFGSDTDDNLQAAPEGDDSEEGGLDLGDDGDALEFGSDSDDEIKATPADDEEVGGLDLGDDGGELELGQDDSLDNNQVASADDDDFGGLDLSESDDDEDIGKTVVMNTEDAGLNFGMPEDSSSESTSEDSSSEVDFSGLESDTSLSGIDSEALSEAPSEGEEVNLDDALTGITEENLEEFDYTGSVSAEEDASDETLDEFAELGDMSEDAEETEATMVAGAEFDAGAVMGEEDLLDDSDTLLSGMEEEESSEDDDLLQSLTATESKAATPGSAVAATSVRDGARDPILVKTYNEEEMVRHQGLIRQLREEREDLLKQIQELKTNLRLGESENLGLRAELDELKIEKSIMKKRHQQELEEMRYALKLADEKRDIFEERARKVQKEFDKLNHKVRIDFNTVKQREKELEGQLELLKMDSQSQVESRDKKILELKRKIDALEFNMENAHIKEQKSKEDKVKLEEKLHKVMKTLRSSIKVMEDDLEIDHLLSHSSESDSENETSE